MARLFSRLTDLTGFAGGGDCAAEHHAAAGRRSTGVLAKPQAGGGWPAEPLSLREQAGGHQGQCKNELACKGGQAQGWA